MLVTFLHQLFVTSSSVHVRDTHVYYNNTSVMMGRYEVGIISHRNAERRAPCDNQARRVRDHVDEGGGVVVLRLPCPKDR